MQTALLQLAEDFLTAIVFVIIYLATDNLVAAVGIAIAIGIGQFALLRLSGRSIDGDAIPEYWPRDCAWRYIARLQ